MFKFLYKIRFGIYGFLTYFIVGSLLDRLTSMPDDKIPFFSFLMVMILVLPFTILGAFKDAIKEMEEGK